MKAGQRLLTLLGVVTLIAFSASAQITVSRSAFESYFSIGQPIRFLVDTSIFSSETPTVNVGLQGGPNVYDFSNATLVEYATDTLRSVSTDPFLSQRFAPEHFTFTLPEDEGEEEGSEYPILSVTDEWFSVVGQYRVWTQDSVRIRHNSPGEPLFFFPVTYQDSIPTVVTYAETTYVGGLMDSVQSYGRTITAVVDGWGTLKLPGGVEYNVLRVRDYQDSGDGDSGKEFRFLTDGGGMLFVGTDVEAPDTGWVAVNGPVQYIINPSITSSEVPRVLPTGFELTQNYPNPFNPSTTIRYSVPVGSKVRLTVYNILGQELAVLDEGEKSAGWHTVRWNAASHPSGLYFVRLHAGAFVSTKKVVLLK